ncbi:MAG: hypothetical protein ABIO70_16625 [Pseudomonadota bacterium]
MKPAPVITLRSTLLFAGLGALALLFAGQSSSPARAQDDEGGLGGGGLLDIDIGDIDLGGDSKGGEQSMTYEGQAAQDAANYKAGTPVYITHTKGNISVRCTDSAGIQARINFAIDGTKQDVMKRVGDTIGLRTYASTTQGKVTSSVPGKQTGVDAIHAPLTVNLPREAKVSVTGGDGWIQVVGCTGTVKATTRNGGIFVDGVLSSFDLSTGQGDIEVSLDPSAEVTSSSRASATGGDVILRMPITQKGNLTARGAEVAVDHLVNGTNTATSVQGTLSDSGPSISVTAKGKVTITTPK